MVDVHGPETRRRIMQAVKSRNTKPELKVRQALHVRGLRYRLHLKSLPGTPDLVFAKFRSVVFINGCFWHKHTCSRFTWPKTRRDFWFKKINKNVENDVRNIAFLQDQGWRVATIWECELRKHVEFEKSMTELVNWLQEGQN